MAKPRTPGARFGGKRNSELEGRIAADNASREVLVAAYNFVCPKCGAQPMESCRSVTKIGAPYIGRPHAERPRCKADLGPAYTVRRSPLRTKCCRRCKLTGGKTPFTCRACCASCCEHLCGSKNGIEATCGTCQAEGTKLSPRDTGAR